jgi:hypothetical protein
MSSERISRRFVTIAAWWTFSMIVFGFISLAVPGVRQGLASPTPGSAGYTIIKMLTAATGIVLIGGWIATIWHAALNPSFRSVGQRAAVLAMIVLRSAISPFIYYFGYLRWALPRVDSTAAA